MINNTILFALSETDKRILIALCFLLIFLFVVVGYIGLLISRIMKSQGRRMDTLMHDIVVTRVVSDRKGFLKVARKKNWRYFFKTTWIPLLILVFDFILLLIAESLNDFNYNIFDYEKQGFTTLFFLWDFDGAEKASFFGLFEIMIDWPPLLNSPHFEVEAIWSYFFAPIFLVGIIWYLFNLQALIARTIKMYQLSNSIYVKNLENYNLNQENMEQVRANQQAINQARINQIFNTFNQPNNLNNLPTNNLNNTANPQLNNQNLNINPNNVLDNSNNNNNNNFNNN